MCSLTTLKCVLLRHPLTKRRTAHPLANQAHDSIDAEPASQLRAPSVTYMCVCVFVCARAPTRTRRRVLCWFVGARAQDGCCAGSWAFLLAVSLQF